MASDSVNKLGVMSPGNDINNISINRDDGGWHSRPSPVPIPLAGPGTSRANRRLQLRKAGFRGKAVQENRNITPTPTNRGPSSGTWSSHINDLGALLDGSSDSKMHDRFDSESRRRSSNILQEVSNSSLRRKGKSRPKMDALVSVWDDENAQQAEASAKKAALWQIESSPACLPPDAPDLTRGKKKLQRTQSEMVRDSMIDEKIQYIEHLELQLAATQTQLASITSPTVTQARSHKIRALNSQIRSLQDELADWELRYDDRIQQEVDKRAQIESNLRSRVRSLEEDMDAYAQNAKELQYQLEQTRNLLDAAESTNIELERRLDTFANIVATSPQKSEFAFQPLGDKKGHIRRRSSLGRFPTTASVLAGATSNMLQPPTPSTYSIPPRPATASGLGVREESSFSSSSQQFQAQRTDEVDFAYTEAASKRDSMLSATSSRLSWTLPEGVNSDALIYNSAGKARPSRKMRRFHAGTLVPKSLILPTATQLNTVPATAPPMDTHDSPPSFPFPNIEEVAPRRMSLDDSPLLLGRRRAYTSAEDLTLQDVRNLSQTHSNHVTPPRTSSGSVNTDTPPHTGTTKDTPLGHYSSPGSVRGHNLFEELQRAQTARSTTPSDVPATSSPSHPESSPFPTLTRSPSNTSPLQLHQRRIIHKRSMSEHTALPLRSRSRTVVGLMSPFSPQTSRASSPLPRHDDEGVAGVPGIWHQPYTLARRCLTRSERLMLLSSGINEAQWWLLSFLLGPLASRRLSASAAQPRFTSPMAAREWRRHCKRNSKSLASIDPACPCHGRSAQQSRGSFISRHSPFLWIKFGLTVAFAVGAAIKDGPASLLSSEEGEIKECTCSSFLPRIASFASPSTSAPTLEQYELLEGGAMRKSLADKLEEEYGYERTDDDDDDDEEKDEYEGDDEYDD